MSNSSVVLAVFNVYFNLLQMQIGSRREIIIISQLEEKSLGVVFSMVSCEIGSIY